MRRRAFRLILLGFAVCFACNDSGGADTLEITKFELNECQSRAATSSLLTGRHAADYTGLECVAWDFASDQYALDLIHVPAGCGFRGSEDETLWQPIVKRGSRSSLEYDVQWNFADPNACGGCIHDFSVMFEEVDLDDDLRIETKTRSCTKCPWARDSVDTNHERAGVRCRYGDWRELSPSLRAAGTENQPARDDGTCDDDLQAVEVKGTTRCLPSCKTDEDCPAAELQACTAGACQLTKSW